MGRVSGLFNLIYVNKETKSLILIVVVKSTYLHCRGL